MEENVALVGKSALGALIVQKYGTHQEFAKALGKSRQSWSRQFRIFNFRSDEVIKIANLLGIPRSQYGLYFYK
jgi:hypothetical protein